MESLIGGCISVILSFFITRYYKSLIETIIQDEGMHNLLIWGLGILLSLVIFFLIQMIIIAPFQIYQKQKKEIFELSNSLQKARKEINNLVNCDIPDLSFDNAINEVKKLFPDKSDVDIQKKIEEMIFNEKMSAWGQPVFSDFLPTPEKLTKIPHKFFYFPNGANTENQGFLYEIYTNLPGWEEYRNHQKYLNVCLNREQLMTIFSNLK